MTQKPNIIILENTALMIKEGADIIRRAAQDSMKRKGRFLIAVSGGSTPRPLHRLLAEEPYYSEIPWNKTELFWVDERCVPADHPASNFGAAQQDLLCRVPIPLNRVHPMPVDMHPEEGALRYQREIINCFKAKHGEFPVFDLIYLGLGYDGHTASLFPGHRAVEETKKLVDAVRGGNPDVSRLTMTFPLLNHARQIIFMVSGKGKSSVLKAIFENRTTPVPAQRVHPSQGKITWLLDSEAASLLTRESDP